MRNEAEHGTPKNEDYYVSLNEHILESLPEGAVRFLDVGCAAGKLGAAIKRRRPGSLVHGIDREAGPVEQAKLLLDQVFQVNLDADPPVLEGPYDCVICGDVLEHLVDPWKALRWLVSQLTPAGHVIASIPNVRYYKVLRDLVFHGRFRYRDSGVLDSTHLRFFTLEEMERLFASADLRILSRRPRIVGGNSLMKMADLLCFGRLEEFRAVQYTLVGQRIREGR